MISTDTSLADQIAEDYKTSTLRQLALRYEKSHETIRRLLIKKGVRIRRKGQGPTYSGRPRLANALPTGYREEDVVDALLKGIETLKVARYLKVKKPLIERIARRNGLVQMAGKWSRA